MRYTQPAKKLFLITAIILTTVLTISSTSLAAEKDKALYQKCEEHKTPLLKELETYVNIDSGSGYEPGIKKLQGLLIERLKQMGAEVT